ncbi:MAG: ankyrin repeat domain-containing protein, partial [Pseudomonadota bacterium]|nr:ankyrin repeat domain-containing protein [Pseudomonadota bacterium]
MKLRALLAGAAMTALLLAGAQAAQRKDSAAVTAPAYPSIAEAARSQDWPAVRAMARQPGAALNAVSTEGSTALHFAIHAGEAAVVQALLDAGTDVTTRNVAGISPLQLAVTTGDTAITRLLLARGADAKALDEAKESLLMLAARHGDGEMASALIAAGAELNYVEPQLGQDALMIAV